MNIFNLIKMLADAKVEFVLVGGLAVALQGYQRLTMDVDLDALANPKLIEQWHREKGMLAFSLRGADAMAMVLDILVKPVVAFADLRRDATMIAVSDLHIPVASIEHLIEMKTGTGRSKDLIDIEELRKIQELK
jgi:predicted nucleotidyltransferase